MSCTWQTENRKWEILHFSVKAEFSTDGKISQSLGLETSAASFARCEHCPTRTWRRPRGRGQGSLRTRRQATSKDRLAPLSRQRCCWTLRWGWTGGCLFWKLKKLFLQRASTWNSDKAFDSLFFCRFLQDLLRAVHGRAPHISYFKIIQIWAISARDFLWPTCIVGFYHKFDCGCLKSDAREVCTLPVL